MFNLGLRIIVMRRKNHDTFSLNLKVDETPAGRQPYLIPLP